MVLRKQNGDVVEGGYGWVVVIACFFCGSLVSDSYASFGVFMVECVERFEVSESDVSWIGAIRISISGLSGIVIGGLAQIFSYRSVTIVGTILVCCGHMLTGLFPQFGFPWLMIMYGVIAGFGYGCLCVVFTSAFQDYFHKYSGTANGLVTIGIASGIFFWPPFLEFLFANYGWRGGFFIDAAIHLNGFVIAMIVIPASKRYSLSHSDESDLCGLQTPETNVLSAYTNLAEEKHYYMECHQSLPHLSLDKQCSEAGWIRSHPNLYLIKDIHVSDISLSLAPSLLSLMVTNVGSNNSLQCKEYKIKPSITIVTTKNKIPNGLNVNGKHQMAKMGDISINGSFTSMKYEHHLNNTIATNQSETNSKCSDISCSELLDFSLLKKASFLMYCIGIGFIQIGVLGQFVLLPSRAVAEGIGKVPASFLVSIIGICNGLCRIVWGCTSDIRCIRPYRVLLVGGSAILDGATSVLLYFAHDYTSFVIYACLWGIFSGCFSGLQYTLAVSFAGVKNAGKGAGTLLSMMGISWFISCTLSGVLIDVFGNTTSPFFVLGGMEIIGGIIISTILFIPRLGTNKH